MIPPESDYLALTLEYTFYGMFEKGILRIEFIKCLSLLAAVETLAVFVKPFLFMDTSCREATHK